jgi:ferredoxin
VTQIDKLLALVQAPVEIKPHLHFFYRKEEIELILSLERRKLPVDEIASCMQIPLDEAADLLESSYRRFVIDKEIEEGRVLYGAGNFYDRHGYCAMFENYHLLPRKLRRFLHEWCYSEYLKRHDYFKRVLNGEPAYDHCHNDVVLLLEELEEMIEAAPVIRLLPCDCKMIADKCGHSREVCLWFSPAMIAERTRGGELGRELTRDAALELARSWDREGLIHTGGPFDWREKGPGVVCNCCDCCCFPLRAAQELGTRGKWPYSRYVARRDPALCRHCGLCTRRCQFKAFTMEKAAVSTGSREKRKVLFKPELCWGCGLCAQTCPEKAITMVPIPDRVDQKRWKNGAC